MDPSSGPAPKRSPNKIFLAVMLFALLHGLAYVFIVPPWQHYDEPTHFEHAWIIANSNHIPAKGEFDNRIRREIQRSMIETGRFDGLQAAPDSQDPAQPVWIGVSQVGDPPLYYLLASLPLRVLSRAPLLTQLYAGRLLSLGLFLLTVWLSFAFAALVFRPGPLRWMAPLLTAALPSLVDLNSAMSSDSAAILVYSLQLFLGVRLLKRGPSRLNIALFGLSLLLCLWTKSSTWVAFLNLPLFLAFFLFSRFKRWVSWAVIAAGLLGLAAVVLQFDDAAYWFRGTNQQTPTRALVSVYGYSDIAFHLSSDPAGHANALYQSIPAADIAGLYGQDVTLGVWIWADRPLKVNAPMIAQIGEEKSWNGWQPIYLSQTPTFYAQTIRLPQEYRRISFVMNPFEGNASQGQVYFYAPILAPGAFSAETRPEFLDSGLTRLRWDGVETRSLLRNASTLATWPRFRPWVSSLAYKIDPRLGEGLAWMVYTLDFEGISGYAQGAVNHIFQTFWARFGWGEISLAGGKPYAPLKAASALALLGAAWGFYRRFDQTSKRAVFWLGASLLFSILYAWFTGVSTGAFTGKGVTPVARFVYPSALAAVSLLCFGWYQAAEFALPRKMHIFTAAFLAALALLDAYALYSLLRAFHS